MLKRVLLFVCLAATPSMFAQGSCNLGSVASAVQNTPISCVVVSTPVGTTISSTGMTAGATALPLCGTVTDPTNPLTPDPCPAGLYYVFVSMETVTPGTVASAMAATANYTTDVRNYPSASVISSYSLVGSNPPPASGFIFFRKAGNTAVTLTTTAVGLLTGSPAYNLYARVVRVP